MKKWILFVLAVCAGSITNAQIGWGPTIDVATQADGNNHPHIVLNRSGNPVISWGDGSGNLLVSTWTGSSFTAPVQLNSPGMDILEGSNYGPEIAAHGDTVYGVFKQTPVTSGNVFVARSTDGGLTFGTPVQVDNIGSNLSEYCHVGVDNAGHPLVLFNQFGSNWANPRWSFVRSSDYGMTFTTDTMVNGTGGGGSIVCECCPAAVVPMASDPGVVVAYRNNQSNIRNTWAAVSTDGVGFTDAMDVDQLNWNLASCPNTGPDITVVGDTVYATYFTAAAGSGRVYYSKSSINPPTGQAAIPVTGTISGVTNQNYPRLSISGNAGVIVWRQSISGNQTMALAYTPDITQGFPGTYEEVAPDNATIGDVVMDGADIYVVWRDYIDGTVKYRKGTVGTVGINDAMAQEVNVYPNPTSENWWVEVPAGTGKVSLQLYDLEGRLVQSFETNSNNQRIQIPGIGLADGIYHLQVVGDTFSEVLELVKR